LWLLALALDISGAYIPLVIAAIMTVSNFLIGRKDAAKHEGRDDVSR
jgi:hypothetical protein